jgi:hypothetical protein
MADDEMIVMNDELGKSRILLEAIIQAVKLETSHKGSLSQ